MSDIRKPDTEMVLAVTPETAKQLAERPLLAVPPELRKPVFQAWAAFRHLNNLETPAPIAFLVGVWVGEHGVGVEVVRKALVRISSPEFVKSIRFASDLTATLADLVTPVQERVYDVV